MVNVTKGILVECDPAMKQFLLHLDEKFLLGSKFIIQGRFKLFLGKKKIFLYFEGNCTGTKLLQKFHRFVILDLDETHLFISPDVLDMLKSQIDDLMDKISVPIVEGKEALKN